MNNLDKGRSYRIETIVPYVGSFVGTFTGYHYWPGGYNSYIKTKVAIFNNISENVGHWVGRQEITLPLDYVSRVASMDDFNYIVSRFERHSGLPEGLVNINKQDGLRSNGLIRSFIAGRKSKHRKYRVRTPRTKRPYRFHT